METTPHVINNNKNSASDNEHTNEIIDKIRTKDDAEDKDTTCHNYIFRRDPKNDIKEKKTTHNKYILNNLDKEYIEHSNVKRLNSSGGMINSKSKVDNEREKIINVDKNYIQHNEIRTLLKPPNTRSTTHTPHQENIIPPIVGRNNKIKRIHKSSQLEEDGIKITKLLTFTTKEKLPRHSNKLKNQRPVDLEKDNKYY